MWRVKRVFSTAFIMHIYYRGLKEGLASGGGYLKKTNSLTLSKLSSLRNTAASWRAFLEWPSRRKTLIPPLSSCPLPPVRTDFLWSRGGSWERPSDRKCLISVPCSCLRRRGLALVSRGQRSVAVHAGHRVRDGWRFGSCWVTLLLLRADICLHLLPFIINEAHKKRWENSEQGALVQQHLSFGELDTWGRARQPI